MNECITVGPFLVVLFFVDHHNAMFVSKGELYQTLIFLNVFKKGEFLFLNECNTVGHFPAHLPLLCGSSQCFPPQETSTYVSSKDSSLDTSGKIG